MWLYYLPAFHSWYYWKGIDELWSSRYCKISTKSHQQNQRASASLNHHLHCHYSIRVASTHSYSHITIPLFHHFYARVMPPWTMPYTAGSEQNNSRLGSIADCRQYSTQMLRNKNEKSFGPISFRFPTCFNKATGHSNNFTRQKKNSKVKIK